MMRRLFASTALAAAVLATGATPTFAHHSTAEFDYTKTIAVAGTVKEVQWTNPHSYIHLAVTRQDGTVQEWACEGANPGALSRRGFQRGDIKIGDTLTIDGFLAKNGSHLIDARRIFVADGKVIYGGSAGDGGPGDTGAE